MNKASDVELFSKQGVLLRRSIVNSYIYKKFSGVVQHGPLKGFRILEDSSWGNDKAAKILGFYELEILLELADDVRNRHFVDLGAADGYYAVGFLKNGIARSVIAFEATDAGKDIIYKTAKDAGVADSIKIHGIADENFLDLIDFPLEETVFLMDIEGGEFNLLDRRNLYRLRKSIVYIEIHDFDAESKKQYQALLESADEFFDIKEIKKIARDPYCYDELAELDDSDHWLACSEGRAPDAKWLKLMPY